MGREVIVYGNELYHHGIKGQKWGVRRYQNEDGTLTEEGRKKYARDQQKILNDLAIEDRYLRGDQERSAKYIKKYTRKYEKAAQKGNGDKAAKYLKKIADELNENSLITKTRGNILVKTNKLLKDLEDSGFSVSKKETSEKQIKREQLGMALVAGLSTMAVTTLIPAASTGLSIGINQSLSLYTEATGKSARGSGSLTSYKVKTTK